LVVLAEILDPGIKVVHCQERSLYKSGRILDYLAI